MTDSTLLVERVLSNISDARVAVIGDLCVDHYLFVAESAAETSLETGLHTRQVGDVRVAPGGAGNVVNNLGSLGVGSIEAIGVVGDDMYGRELTRMLREAGANTEGLVVQRTAWQTSVYTKVYEGGAEDPRLDIGARNRLSHDSSAAVLSALRAALSRVDVVILNQQIKEALFAPTFREEVARLLASDRGVEKLVDSRDYANEFPGTVRKINLHEARFYSNAEGLDTAERSDSTDSTDDTHSPSGTGPSVARVRIDPEVKGLCSGLSRHWGTPIVVTRGQDGCVVANGESIDAVPGVSVPRPLDPVGAGDALLAGMAGARAMGIPLSHAAQVGNLCAAVSVKKLYQAGTTSAEELRDAAAHPAFRMRPDLAYAPERAERIGRTRIEVVTSLPHGRRYEYAIFDHDGTISVLREGWEPVMQDVMVRAILGTLEPSTTAPTCGHSQESVEQAASELISDTTGIQTIEQMHALRGLIRSFGCVPESEIRTAEEYKNIYLEALQSMIDRRSELIRRGVLDREDVTMKGAVEMLHALHERGITLFLASGSDHDAVVEEAELLGYAELFDGGIYGSVGDAAKDPKTIVLDQILNRIGDEASGDVVTFGDGPVEIRETNRRGGTAVGVASDEVRRHGLNTAKRRRVILAGADLVIPDFAELNEVLDVLFGAD